MINLKIVCMNINNGWPDNENLITGDPTDLG